MRTHDNLSLKATVTAREIEQVLALRRTFEAQKKRLEMAENALNEAEQNIMVRINTGAAVISPHQVSLKSIERRNVGWKSVLVEHIGHEAAEAILNDTAPTVTYRLLITEAA